MATLKQVNDIPSFVVRDLLVLGEDLGMDVLRWQAAAGLDWPSKPSPDIGELTWRTSIDVIAAAVSQYPNFPFGLIIARRETLSSYGLLGFAILSAPSLQDALVVGVRHHHLAGSLTDIGFQVMGDEVCLFLDYRENTPGHIQPFLVEEMFGGMLTCIRTLVGDFFKPTYASFPFPEPGYSDKYREHFGNNCHFNAERCEMRFPAKWLEVTLATGNPISFRQSLELCDKLNSRFASTKKDWVGELRALLGSRLKQVPTIGEVAAMHNLSERSLRRRLKEEGFTYRSLLASIRLSMADHLLKSGLRVEEVAVRVGFSEAREFRRAFKRYAGITPSEAKGG